jgi:hypothetical protein
MNQIMIPNRLRLTAALALAVTAGACDQGLTGVNDNPNAPTDVEARFLFAQGVKSSVDRALGANFDLTLTSLWTQHVAKIQYIDEDRYELRDATVNAHWAGFYAGPLQDFQIVRQKATVAGNANQVAAARIMQSWTFQQMTDVWGDIPYSQALQGESSEAITSPVYDTQRSIYTGMLAELTTATGEINPSAGTFSSGDILYEGDAAAWRRFSNSLRLRMAMRMSQADATAAQAQVSAALAAAGGVFTSNAHNATLRYAATAPSQNPLFVNFQTRFDHVVSKTMVDSLLSLSDPRLTVYATPAPSDGAYRGMPNGLTNDHGIVFSTLSRIGTEFLRPDAPAVLMSYAEVLFLQAEAAQRGWGAGVAATLYAQGIRASLEQHGIPSAQIDAYLLQPRVVYNPANGLAQIALQKWIALYMNGPEAYAEWRRTGVPNLAVVPASSNGSRIPVRVFYPSSEQSYNNTNLQAAVARNGGNTLNDPVWWDK